MVKNIKNKIIKDSFDGYKNFRLVHIVFKITSQRIIKYSERLLYFL